MPSVTYLSATPFPLPLWHPFSPSSADSGPCRIRPWGLQSHVGKKPITALPGAPISLVYQSCSTVHFLASGELPLAGSMLEIPNRLLLKLPTQPPYPSFLAYIFSESKEKIEVIRARAPCILLIYLKYVSSCLRSISIEGEGPSSFWRSSPSSVC